MSYTIAETTPEWEAEVEKYLADPIVSQIADTAPAGFDPSQVMTGGYGGSINPLFSLFVNEQYNDEYAQRNGGDAPADRGQGLIPDAVCRTLDQRQQAALATV